MEKIKRAHETLQSLSILNAIESGRSGARAGGN
jgi:hypothetical protein